MMVSLKSLAQELFDAYDSYRFEAISTCRFTHADMLRWLQPFDAAGLYAKSELGASAEGRLISLYTIGSGPTQVLLWSQMHGDEPTATMAILDIFNFLHRNPQHLVTKSLKENFTLLFIPMLNPDGAQRFTRRTAHQIDMNRDALATQTPEGKILKNVRDKFQPEYGFNLHDQDPRMTVGTTRKIAAAALLAPAADESRMDTSVRLRAKKVASTLAMVLQQYIPGQLAKWDDTFEPRAFGDCIQKWGTSTVLFESGGWKGDPNKFFIRKLNCISLLTTLVTIASGDYQKADLQVYEQIPFNTKFGCDYLIRNAAWSSAGGRAVRVDVAVNVDKKVNPLSGKLEDIATIIDIGDLHTFAALEEERDAHGAELDMSRSVMERPFPAHEIDLLLRRG